MFHNVHDVAAYIRYHNDELARERQRCSPIRSSEAASPHVLSRLRRHIGVGLMRLGAAVVGEDARRGMLARSAWPEFANR